MGDFLYPFDINRFKITVDLGSPKGDMSVRIIWDILTGEIINVKS